MLALAALIKGSSSSAQPLDQAILVTQVLVIVFMVCAGAFYLTTTALQNWLASHADSNEIQFWIFLNLRLLEPLLIFFFLMESIAYLATGLAIGNAAMFIGAGFLVAALVQSIGMRPILDAVRASMPVISK